MGFGKWLKKRFKIQPLNRYFDDIGTIAGFALGGPAGAAIGRTAGTVAEKGKHVKLGDVAMAAGTGYAAGSLGEFAGAGKVFGRGAAEAATAAANAPAVASRAATPAATAIRPEIAQSIAMGGSAAPLATSSAVQGARPGVASFLKKGMSYFTEPGKGMDRTLLATQALGSVGNAYGSYKQGQMQDFMLQKQLEEEERMRELLDPFVRKFADRLRGRMEMPAL